MSALPTTMEGLSAFALSWAAEDPDPATAAAARALVASGDLAALADHFGSRLVFGTAGLRGALGPGPNRMNQVLVRRVTAGLGRYLLEHVPEARVRGVVIGFDGRIGSREFALDAALVLAAQGIPSYLHADLCPTPQLAQAVTHLGAAAGIMVTASHNPPQDNGYKAYWGNGAQIVPPQDAGISQAVDEVTTLADLPLPTAEAARASGLLRDVPEAAVLAYLKDVAALRVHHSNGLRIVYTAMHGVGKRLLERVLGPAGHTDLHMVAEQVEPDGRFPTVKFPNPEEPGALDLAMALAARVQADVIIAHDPDADRLAVAVPRPDGTWRPLTGNEVGCLLAEDLLSHGAGVVGSAEGAQAGARLVATTIVSSALLARIAAAHGASYAETLTGFKWIANAAIRHEATGGRFVMGYEEALGYSVGPVVRDKDGVSAALLLCDLAAFEKARGRTLLDALESLSRRYGHYVSAQKSLTLPGGDGARQIREMMADLRRTPPTAFAEDGVVATRDLSVPDSPDLPAADVLAWTLGGCLGDRSASPATRPTADPGVAKASDIPDIAAPSRLGLGRRSPTELGPGHQDSLLEGGGRVLARPSGTEPKIKFYFEACEPVSPDESLDAAAGRARARLDRWMSALMTRLGRG